jgi:hypothetical protein
MDIMKSVLNERHEFVSLTVNNDGIFSAIGVKNRPGSGSNCKV